MKGLSRLENCVEKQIRSVGLGGSGSMTTQALGQGLNDAMLPTLLGVKLNALG